jgi:hypothetical protein
LAPAHPFEFAPVVVLKGVDGMVINIDEVAGEQVGLEIGRQGLKFLPIGLGAEIFPD